MKFLKNILVIFSFLLFSLYAHSQEVEVIISKNIDALGSEDAL